MLKSVKKISIIFVISLFFPVVQVVNAQYLSDSDVQRNALNDKEMSKKKKIDAVLGKTFWYRPGTADSFRTAFYEKYGPWRSGSSVYEFTGKFYLTKETRFKVLDADFKKLRIEFDDGRIAYLETYTLAEHGEYSLIGNFSSGPQTANNAISYIFPEQPFKIENPVFFKALDEILGKKFWYKPILNPVGKLNFVGEMNTETGFIIESYTIELDSIDIRVQIEGGVTNILKIEKAGVQNMSTAELPFVYVSKDKAVLGREYLYSAPPSQVLAVEAANKMARSAATAKEKATAVEERVRLRNDAIAAITKELKAAPKNFEVRGLNLGFDHYQDVIESKGFSKGLEDLEDFPGTRIGTANDGGKLYFYRDILFMAIYDDLQDSIELRAAMNQLEAKFKGKFSNISPKKSIDGNVEINTAGVHMNIANIGTAEVKLMSTRPVNKRICIEEIARDIRQSISLGLKQYSSLTDRVERECRELINPMQMVFINKQIEAIANSRANAEWLSRRRQAAEEKLKAANEKAKKF